MLICGPESVPDLVTLFVALTGVTSAWFQEYTGREYIGVSRSGSHNEQLVGGNRARNLNRCRITFFFFKFYSLSIECQRSVLEALGLLNSNASMPASLPSLVLPVSCSFHIFS